jgi:hypothetical protein
MTQVLLRIFNSNRKNQKLEFILNKTKILNTSTIGIFFSLKLVIAGFKDYQIKYTYGFEAQTNENNSSWKYRKVMKILYCT